MILEGSGKGQHRYLETKGGMTHYLKGVCASLYFICIYLYSICDANSQEFEIGTSPNPVGSGARALGMGNAFIAMADDATAASWNPGGLSQLEKPEFSFAGEVFALRESVSSTSNPEVRDTRTLELIDLNYASLVFPFYYRTNMVISVNFLKLFRFDKSFEFPVVLKSENIESSFDFDFEQEGTLSVFAPAYSLNVTKQLSLGVTWNIWNDSITQASAYEKKEISTGTTSFGNLVNDFSLEEVNKFEVTDGHSFTVGGNYRFTKHWNLGFVLKPSYTLDLDHKRTLIVHPTNDQEELQSQVIKTDSEFSFPWIVGAGIAWRPMDVLTVSTDVTWTDWSEFTFKEEGEKTNPVSGRPVSEGRLDDTFTLRVGGEFLLIRDNYVIPFRCGMGYDPAPAVDSVDDFYTINVGSGIQLFKRVNFDIAYEFRWGDNVNGDTFQGIKASEDIRQHRILASMIYFF